MPINAIEQLLSKEKTELRDLKKKKFSFSWLSKEIGKRQNQGKDTIIIVSGDRRAGKSNWALKLIRQYIKQRREQDPDFRWSWERNFPLSRRQSKEMARKLFKSFIFHDEGGDQFLGSTALKKAQRDLVTFMNKSGSKLHLTIIIWPDLFQLSQQIINMAHLLVIIPYRFRDVCSFAFIYGRNPNPFTYDKFGVSKIRKKLESPTKSSVFVQLPSMDDTLRVGHGGQRMTIPYPRQLFKFLRTIPTFLKSHRFGPVDKRFEDTYKKNVKEKLLDERKDDNFVPYAVHQRVKLQYETLLWNLYTRGEMSYAQLERLHISPVDGAHLRSITTIKKAINSVEAQT